MYILQACHVQQKYPICHGSVHTSAIMYVRKTSGMWWVMNAVLTFKLFFSTETSMTTAFIVDISIAMWTPGHYFSGE